MTDKEVRGRGLSVLQCMFRRKRGGKVSGGADRNFINTANLTVIALGTHFGYGVYVVSSFVAQKIAGPAILLSFGLAAICNILCGICFAELSTRSQPFGQSLHGILHQFAGEFAAFLASWLSILTHNGVIATCARALSGILDYVSGQRLSVYLRDKIGDLPLIDSQPDFLAFIIVVVFVIICASNFDINRTLAYLLNILTFCLTVFILVSMVFFSRNDSWFDKVEFTANGSKSVVAGASLCFYCFVGFEFVLTKGRESMMSSNTITAIMAVSNVVCLLFFLGMSCSFLVVAPSANFTSLAPLLESVDTSGATWLVYVMALSSFLAIMPVMINSMSSSLISVCTISSDCKNCFSCKFQDPDNSTWAVVVSGFVSAILALFLDVMIMLNLTVLPCLLLNVIMIVVMMLRRFKPDESDPIVDDQARQSKIESSPNPESFNSSKIYSKLEKDDESETDDTYSSDQSETDIDAVVQEYKEKIRIASLKNFESPASTERQQQLKRIRAKIGRGLLITVIGAVVVTFSLVGYGYSLLVDRNVGFILVVSTCCILILLSSVLLTVQAEYQNTDRLVCRMPLVPLAPMIALALQVFLITVLPWQAMLAVVTWTILGAGAYFACLSFKKCRPVITEPSICEEERILLQPLPSYSSNLQQPASTSTALTAIDEECSSPSAGGSHTRPISFNVNSVQVP